MERSHFRPSRLTLILLIISIISSGEVSAQFLKQLIPDGVLSQYGGSIGYGSIGLSYGLFKKDRGSLDFTYGHVPESKGGTLDILSAKFAYRPLKINVNKWASFYALNPGTFVSYHLGKDFRNLSKDQYPEGYYWWSKAVRVHLSLSNEVKINAKKVFPKTGIKDIRLYAEYNINELYAVSLFDNEGSMSIFDIVRTGYGIRVYF